MKAWLVREKDAFCATVVFAETRGKARSVATHTEACEDAAFVDIEVRRAPQMDKYYTEGKREMYWCNSSDRIALVKDCGFVCDRDCWELGDCDNCPAKEYCDQYADLVADQAEEDGEQA